LDEVIQTHKASASVSLPFTFVPDRKIIFLQILIAHIRRVGFKVMILFCQKLEEMSKK
jgi:7-cyano-7-deazaguanine synthase in queuosine biosynthesis